MDLEDLIKAVVPLSFLAIWALTSVFNREARPLPPMANRPPAPYPPRPAAPTPGPRPTEPRPMLTNREPTLRWSQPGQPATPAAGRSASSPGGAEDILIIRNDPVRPPSVQPGRPNVAQPRRGRSKPASASKPAELTTTRPTLGAFDTDVSQHLARTIELPPLEQISSSGVNAAGRIPERIVPQVSLADLRRSLRDPARLREAFILNEVLQPPVSHRRDLRRLS
jgi:hypothetical protein